MKEFIDYYAVLGISRQASTKEINTAFKKQSLKWHPDRNRAIDATKKMQGINEAKRILSSKVLRDKYNREYLRFKASNIKPKQENKSQHKTAKNEKVNYSCNLKTDEELIYICANASKYNLEYIHVVLKELNKRNYTHENILEKIKPKPQPIVKVEPILDSRLITAVKDFVADYSLAISRIKKMIGLIVCTVQKKTRQ